jgi:tetratricopeptide (TPR) repeat protein
MRRTLAAVLSSVVLSLAFASAAHAQAVSLADAVRAKAELNEGARAYKDGRFAEAEQHFRRELELDPTYKYTRLFIARATQQQYKPGDASPENVATGERAVDAYRELLDRDRQDDDAYKALVFLYGKLGRGEKVEEMLTMRANDLVLPAEKRAEAFVILASRRWKCSYDVTGPEEKWTNVGASGRAPRRPRIDAAGLIRARQCVDEAMRFIEQAVALDPKSPTTWAYEAHILREASKLAEASGDEAQKADYDRRHDEALDSQKRAAAEAERKERERQKLPAPEATPAPEPRPGAEFSRTLLSGRPVPDKGVVRYNFVLR